MDVARPLWWNDRDMTITIPSGQPNNRFMQYVRPPVKDTEKLPPLFPLRNGGGVLDNGAVRQGLWCDDSASRARGPGGGYWQMR